jgi:hypothetical protein
MHGCRHSELVFSKHLFQLADGTRVLRTKNHRTGAARMQVLGPRSSGRQTLHSGGRPWPRSGPEPPPPPPPRTMVVPEEYPQFRTLTEREAAYTAEQRRLEEEHADAGAGLYEVPAGAAAGAEAEPRPIVEAPEMMRPRRGIVPFALRRVGAGLALAEEELPIPEWARDAPRLIPLPEPAVARGAPRPAPFPEPAVARGASRPAPFPEPIAGGGAPPIEEALEHRRTSSAAESAPPQGALSPAVPEPPSWRQFETSQRGSSSSASSVTAEPAPPTLFTTPPAPSPFPFLTSPVQPFRGPFRGV